MTERLPLCSPQSSLENHGSSHRSPSASPSSPEPVTRSGLSLACNDCPFPGHHLQGQRSRPASSLSHRFVTRSVRPTTSPPCPVGPRLGGIRIAFPLSGFVPAIPIALRTATPL